MVPLGGVSDRLYFLYAGLARSYYLEKGKDMTSWLAQAGALLCVPESFLAQQPSREAIELLEDSTLVSFSHADLQALYAAYPGTNKLGRWVAVRYLILYSEQTRWLRATSAEQRLRQFITKYPELYEKVQLKYIASYLGMAPETLSRILKKKKLTLVGEKLTLVKWGTQKFVTPLWPKKTPHQFGDGAGLSCSSSKFLTLNQFQRYEKFSNQVMCLFSHGDSTICSLRKRKRTT